VSCACCAQLAIVELTIEGRQGRAPPTRRPPSSAPCLHIAGDEDRGRPVLAGVLPIRSSIDARPASRSETVLLAISDMKTLSLGTAVPASASAIRYPSILSRAGCVERLALIMAMFVVAEFQETAFSPRSPFEVLR